jgi:hypothetical protein
MLKAVEKQIKAEEKAEAKAIFKGDDPNDLDPAPDAFDLWKEKAITVNRSDKPEDRIARVDELEDFQPVQKTSSRRGYKTAIEKINAEPRSKKQQEMLDTLRSVPIAKDKIQLKDINLDEYDLSELTLDQATDLLEQLAVKIKKTKSDVKRAKFMQYREMLEELLD